MFKAIKESFSITINNPILEFSFVIYLIISLIFFPRLVVIQSNRLILLTILMLLLLSAGFFAGWFEMVKQAVENSKKTYETEEERALDAINLRKYFFEAIPGYIIPVALSAVLYYVLFAVLIFVCVKFADKFIGSVDFLLKDIKNLTQSNALAVEYLKNLSTERVMIIYGWNTLFTAAIGLFGVFTIFWPSALYYGKNGSKNPFRAFWSSFTAVFKKPLAVIGLIIFIAFLTMVLMPLSRLFALNAFTSFVYMIFTIYFSVFLVVLIFKTYERNFTDYSNNGSDSIGENKAGA